MTNQEIRTNPIKRTVLLFTVIGVLVVGIVVMLFCLVPLYNTLMEQSNQALILQTRLMASEVTQYSARLVQTCEQMASLPEVRTSMQPGADEKTLGSALQRSLDGRNGALGIILLDANGTLLAQAGVPIPPEAYGQPDQFKDAAGLDGILETSSGRLLVAGSPVKDASGKFAGSIMAAFPVIGLDEMLAGEQQAFGETLVLLGKSTPQGIQWIASNHDAQGDLQEKALLAAVTQAFSVGTPNVYQILGLGSRRLVAYSHVSGTQWGVALVVPGSVVTSPINRQVVAVGVLVLVLIAGAAVGANYLTRGLAGVIESSADELHRQVKESSVELGEELHAKIRAQEDLQRQIERTNALRAIDEAIASSLDLKHVLEVVLQQVEAQLKTDASDILLLNSAKNSMDFASGYGFNSYYRDPNSVMLGEGTVGAAAVDHRIVRLPDLKVPGSDIGVSEQFTTDEKFASYYAVPLVSKGELKGMLEIFHRSLLEPDAEWMQFMESLAGQAAIAVDNAILFSDLQFTNLELGLAYEVTLEGWARALEFRDVETEGHSQRVVELVEAMASVMNLSDEELVHYRRGALLHDIGKMGIPDEILLKPGSLTLEERKIIQKHPGYAYKLLSPIPFLGPALDIPYCHHEKWDGTGYPRGLKGEDIPKSARLFALVDVYDALKSDRPYRLAWDDEKTFEYLRAQIGIQFDPDLVEKFITVVKTTWRPSQHLKVNLWAGGTGMAPASSMFEIGDPEIGAG